MLYKKISAALALIIVGGFVLLVGWSVYLLKDNQEAIIALVAGTMGSITTLVVKEFFGLPGPDNGHEKKEDEED